MIFKNLKEKEGKEGNGLRRRDGRVVVRSFCYFSIVWLRDVGMMSAAAMFSVKSLYS